MNILGIIPARGGSKGIPGKNLKLLAGKPLIGHTIDAAKSCKVVSRIIVSTDSQEIAAFAKSSGVDVPFLRPAALSGDTALMIDVVIHALTYLKERDQYEPDAVLLLQPTSPLRTADHIREAVNFYVVGKPDSLVSTIRVPHNFTPESIYMLKGESLQPYLNGEKLYDRKLKPVYFARNGPAILLSSVKTILEKHSFYGETVHSYMMSDEESIDIDTPFEFRIAELLLQNKIG